MNRTSFFITLMGVAALVIKEILIPILGDARWQEKALRLMAKERAISNQELKWLIEKEALTIERVQRIELLKTKRSLERAINDLHKNLHPESHVPINANKDRVEFLKQIQAMKFSKKPQYFSENFLEEKIHYILDLVILFDDNGLKESYETLEAHKIKLLDFKDQISADAKTYLAWEAKKFTVEDMNKDLYEKEKKTILGLRVATNKRIREATIALGKAQDFIREESYNLEDQVFRATVVNRISTAVLLLMTALGAFFSIYNEFKRLRPPSTEPASTGSAKSTQA